jgi:predicted DsbA family dithiol-disulfide isomerase
MTTPRPIRIQFVSDVTCPWCAIGLAGLERAIEALQPDHPVDLHIEPFELNPGLPPEGQDIAEYVALKYGATGDELAQRQALIRARAGAAGLDFAIRTRIWNTFDAHRLLYWAASQGRALALKRALLDAYHGRAENPSAHDVLLRLAGSIGLDVASARAILAGDAYAAEVRARIRRWQAIGITSVPSVVVEDRYLIQGGQTAETYESALREIAAQAVAAGTVD